MRAGTEGQGNQRRIKSGGKRVRIFKPLMLKFNKNVFLFSANKDVPSLFVKPQAFDEIVKKMNANEKKQNRKEHRSGNCDVRI